MIALFIGGKIQLSKYIDIWEIIYVLILCNIFTQISDKNQSKLINMILNLTKIIKTSLKKKKKKKIGIAMGIKGSFLLKLFFPPQYCYFLYKT